MIYSDFAIEQLKDRLWEKSMKDSTPKKYANDMLEAMEVIRQLQRAPAWRDAAKAPPKDEEYVLICTRSKNGSRNIDKGYYLTDSNGVSRWACRGTASVTHWMPLPPLPDEETP